ncbi:S8 family serine peptidase [Salinibacterium sp. dk2585]|uniref:S8 family peptidase n=1 Tax=unclassified Salinibacterium TaxID=2632331 RepID=UPI0011C251DD|nr:MULTISPECIES: S8 family serine peptidase [unclassified Salinibacterium]QEE61945.1 S8 family serine peptidase [Salinibacterium sp. dk2585]TXK54500.1 S8 family serine peptidase [Salinibacterium sp. dk5596]
MTPQRWRGSTIASALVAAFLLALVSPAVSPAAADSIRDREYWLDDYGITQAWAKTRGAGVTVAVIDTGIDGTHPDLAGAVVGGTDVSGVGAPDGQTPVGYSSREHGTMVASLLAGRGTGADSGVIGVAPESNLLSVSVGFGVGTVPSDDQIAQAVRWSVDNGADVINMSLTRNTIEWPESWDEAFLYAMQNDVVVVAAAGNRGSGTTQVGAPATMPGVLTVAGVDRRGNASFDASSQGITISVSAPSEELVGATPGGGYSAWGGTSGAAPIVAGLVALVRSAHPGLNAGDVISRITETARQVPGQRDPSPIYGHGLLDADAAVSGSVATAGEDPAQLLTDWIRLYRRADAEPIPTPTPVLPSPTPIEEQEVAGPVSPLGTVLPTLDQLRLVGIPVLVYTIFVLAFGAAGWLAAREFGRLRRKE